MRKASVFLITVAFIAATVGCRGTTPVKYDVTMSVNTVEGGTAIDLTNASPYTAGTVISIRAVPVVGYRFIHWSAPAGVFDDAAAATTTFTVPAQNVIVTAILALEVRDWYELDAVRQNVSTAYVLMNNLDSTTPGYGELASRTANQGKGWQPIGTGGSFVGSFYGQGHEIRDLFIGRPDENYVGLFGVYAGEAIESLGVTDAEVTGYAFVGGMAGWDWDGTVTNCYSTGSVNGTSYVGGLVGYGYQSTLSNSYSTCSVAGNVFVGGLVGLNENDGTVDSCHAASTVSGWSLVGGLIGRNAGTVDASYSTGTIYTAGASVDAGGLIAVNSGTVTNSYSTCNVSGFDQVGGLVGRNIGTVTSSYSTGNVIGNSLVGGLVGNNQGDVSNSFWDTQTSGQATSDGGTGKTTAEMQDIDTFLGATWDIVAVANPDIRNLAYIWNIVDDETYPFLSW